MRRVNLNVLSLMVALYAGTAVSAGPGGVAQGDVILRTDGWVACRAEQDDTDALYIMLSETSGVESPDTSNACGIALAGGQYRVYEPGAVASDTGVVVVGGDLFRLRRAGVDLYAEYSRDAGESWVHLHKFNATSTDPLYFRAYQNTAGKRVTGVVTG